MNRGEEKSVDNSTLHEAIATTPVTMLASILSGNTRSGGSLKVHRLGSDALPLVKYIYMKETGEIQC